MSRVCEESCAPSLATTVGHAAEAGRRQKAAGPVGALANLEQARVAGDRFERIALRPLFRVIRLAKPAARVCFAVRLGLAGRDGNGRAPAASSALCAREALILREQHLSLSGRTRRG